MKWTAFTAAHTVYTKPNLSDLLRHCDSRANAAINYRLRRNVFRRKNRSDDSIERLIQQKIYLTVRIPMSHRFSQIFSIVNNVWNKIGQYPYWMCDLKVSGATSSSSSSKFWPPNDDFTCKKRKKYANHIYRPTRRTQYANRWFHNFSDESNEIQSPITVITNAAPNKST